MRPIFHAIPGRARPWYRWLIWPGLLTRWIWREVHESVDELWDERAA